MTGIRKILAAVFSLLLLASCSKGEAGHTVKPGNPDLTIDDGGSQEDVSEEYTKRLFEVLNLDYPGLEQVKAQHKAGNDAQAVLALREYYRSRSSVINPYINLVNPSLSANEKNIADQACRSQGYRLYIKNYQEGTDPSTGLALYWSFADYAGNLDWAASPGGITETQFRIQRHRHQWMEIQAKAYRATGDEKYIDYIIDIYNSWLRTYPFPGVKKLTSATFADQWTDLQASSRVMSQVNILQYCVRSDRFTPDFLAEFLVEFANHVESIRANPYYKATSNHRLFEVQAVFTAGVMMPEFVKSSEWLQEGASDAYSQVKAQFNSDGVQGEMDPSYHITVLNSFYEMYILARQNGLLSLFPDDYLSYLRTATGFVRDIMYTDYSMDNFNDTRSSSWSKSVLKRNLGYYYEMFPDEPGLEWLSSERVRGTAPTAMYASYPVSGYYVLRDGWQKASTMLVLKNNDNNDGWWHCQPDNGTFGLYRSGRRFMPDAGSYSYGGNASDNEWRDSFRSTASHNTLTLWLATIADDRMHGRLVREVHLQDGTDGFIVENDSYPGITHRRSVYFVKKKYFVILDEASGASAQNSVEVSFHLCGAIADVQIDTYEGSVAGAHTVFSDDNNMLFKTFAASSDGFAASDSESWWSDSIGKKTARRFYRVASAKGAGSPARFLTVIHPFTNNASIPVSASFGAASVSVEADGVKFSIDYE